MQRMDSFKKTLMLGKIEGRTESGWQQMRWLDGITDSLNMSMGKLGEIVKGRKPGMLQAMGSQKVGQELVTEQQQKNDKVSMDIK